MTEQHIIHKDHVSEVTAGLEYVMSDASTDRYGDVIRAEGWVLDNFRANPVALFGHDSKFIVGRWRDVRVEKGKLLGRLELLPKGVSQRLDEIRAAVEAGVLRAVSVGFRALTAPEPIKDKAGYVYSKQELVECSLVSIPANPNALAIAKELDLSPRARSLVFGESAGEQRSRDFITPGEPADRKKTSHVKGLAMPIALSEQIQASEQRLNALRDQVHDIVSKSDGEGLDEDESTAITELKRRIEREETSLTALRDAEKLTAVRSAPVVSQTATPAAPAVRRPFDTLKKETKPAEYIFRAATAHVIAHATGKDIDHVLSHRYGDDEGTHIVTKAAVAGATTTTTGWAAELVNTAMADFLEVLRPVSVFPALANGRLAFGPNQGAIKIPSRAATPSIGGSFVGEAAPIPVRRLGLASITLTPHKMGVISVFSREIARYSNPAIEGLLRREIVADTAITMDSLLLDTAAGSAVRPAGLLNGVTPLTATAGGGHAAILGDLRKLQAPFAAANASRDLVLLMNPAQALALALTPGPDGTLGWTQQVMGNFRIVTSTAVTAGSLIMIDQADFVTATGDAPQFETSDQAVLHMEDSAPGQLTTGAAAVSHPSQSMFQTAQIAIRMLLDVTWAMRRTGMVQTITGVTW